MGPLQGVKIVEIAGIGPGQLCGMLLADMGAQMIRIVRPGDPDPGVAIPLRFDLMNRSRPSIVVDLKSERGVELVLRLCDDADAIFEGFRPGVMEKLGLGPKQCFARNKRLVYGRMTGFGQAGPLAGSVGHDTNYIALAGVLHAIGDSDRPPPVPLNLIADFGGGGTYLAIGLLAAILEAGRSGQGQVVDAAMVDGAANMMTLIYGLMAAGYWRDERHSNLLDGAAPFVRVYETKDGKYMSVCAIEGRFYTALLESMGIENLSPEEQYDTNRWPEHAEIFAQIFKSKTREEWSAIFEGTDSCAMPVLSMTEAAKHPHNAARGTFVDVDDILQPGPAPRFSRTRSAIQHAPTEPGRFDREVLKNWGLVDAEIKRLHDV